MQRGGHDFGADAVTVRDGDGVSHDVAAGTYTLTTALKLKVDGAPKAQVLTPPLLFQPGAGALALDRPYRGAIQVDVDTGKLRAINVVGLEQYLYGVVPSEMPSITISTRVSVAILSLSLRSAPMSDCGSFMVCAA